MIENLKTFETTEFIGASKDKTYDAQKARNCNHIYLKHLH